MGNYYTPIGRKGSNTGEPCPACCLGKTEYTGARHAECAAKLHGYEIVCTFCGFSGTEWYHAGTFNRKED